MADEPTQNDTDTSETDNGKTFDEAYVKKLRNEAATHRSRVRELEEKVTSAEDLATKNESLTAEINELKAQNDRRNWADEIVKDSAIPASVLRGATKEELQAHFDEISKLVTTPDLDKTNVPADVEQPLALNSTGLESALRNALGM